MLFHLQVQRIFQQLRAYYRLYKQTTILRTQLSYFLIIYQTSAYLNCLKTACIICMTY